MSTPEQQASDQPVIDRISELSDAEQAYIGRLVALTHPDVAESALAGLAEYHRAHPDEARVLLGTGPARTGKLAQQDHDVIRSGPHSAPAPATVTG